MSETPNALGVLKNGDPYVAVEGFNDAIIGFAWPLATGAKCAVYDKNKCIEILMEREGLSEQDAIDVFDYNIAGAYVGEQTPFFVDRCWEGVRNDD